MLTVRAIKKYHDAKGILLGYLIQQEGTSNTMQVTKEQLKNAVRAGQCQVVNLTLTSDNRFIGSAKPLPKRRAKAVQEVSEVEYLVQVLTSGGKPVLGITAFIRKDKFKEIISNTDVKKIGQAVQSNKTRQNIVLRDELEKSMNSYGNTTLKPEGSAKVSMAQIGVSTKKFETQEKVLLDMLNNKGGVQGASIAKIDKTTYSISLSAANPTRETSILGIAFVMNAVMVNKIRVEGYSINEGKIQVKCLTGVADLKKALKGLPFPIV